MTRCSTAIWARKPQPIRCGSLPGTSQFPFLHPRSLRDRFEQARDWFDCSERVLKDEIAAWQHDRNAHHTKSDWQPRIY